MPQCWKCRTVSATAEMRRTPRGHVCKDMIGCRRRQNIPVLPRRKKGGK
jgi:hypothetical protein